MKQKILELHHNDKVQFTWKTRNLGVAEFSICTVFNKGVISDVWIDPLQQEGALPLYHIKTIANQLQILQYGKDKIAPWIYQYCHGHKTMNMRVYVPDNSRYFQVWKGSTLEIVFH